MLKQLVKDCILRKCTTFTYLPRSPEKCLLLNIKVANRFRCSAFERHLNNIIWNWSPCSTGKMELTKNKLRYMLICCTGSVLQDLSGYYSQTLTYLALSLLAGPPSHQAPASSRQQNQTCRYGDWGLQSRPAHFRRKLCKSPFPNCVWRSHVCHTSDVSFSTL